MKSNKSERASSNALRTGRASVRAYRATVIPRRSAGQPQPINVKDRAFPDDAEARSFENQYRVEVVSRHRPRKKPQGMRAGNAPRPKPALAGKTVVRVKSTGICVGILSWGMAVWTLQLWLALLSIIALGATGALDAIAENAAGGFVIRGVDAVFSSFTAAAARLFGTSISAGLLESIEALFVLSLFLTWLTGLVTLMAMGVQCLFSGMRPLSGSGAAWKNGAFILALIGYFIPIANLFPWFVFWLAVIWRYPR